MIRTRFEVLYVERMGGRHGVRAPALRRQTKLLLLAGGLAVAAFLSACTGLGQLVFTALLMAAGLSFFAIVLGGSRSGSEFGSPPIIQADARSLRLGRKQILWTDVQSIERHRLSSRFGDAPCIGIETTEGTFRIGLMSLPDLDQRVEELRALHFRGQGSASDVPEALRVMKERE